MGSRSVHLPESKAKLEEQDILQLILQLIPYVVFWKDLDSRYLGCNEQFAALAGLDSPEDIVGLCDYDLPWSREESDAYRADDREVIVSGQPKLHIIETQVNAQGEKSWVDTSKVPLRDTNSSIIGVLGIFVDITEAKLAQQDLERTRQHLEDALNAIDAGLVMYGADETMVLCNESYKSIYHEAADRIVPGAYYEDLLRVYTERLGMAPRDADSWVAERIAQHRRCEPKWEQKLRDRVIRVNDYRTKDGGIVSLRTDITDEKRREEELSRARAVAEAANEAKASFLANMSHEIRTPMTAILGFTEMLIGDATTSEQAQSLGIVQRNAEHLLSLINDILDLTKIDAGKTRVESAPFDLLHLIEEVVRLMQVRAEGAQLSLSVCYDTKVPQSLSGDATRVRQILVNLVGNAIKFTNVGGVTLGIAACGGGAGPMLEISVEDTGIGIPHEKLGSIFESFEQVDESATRSYGGTGLGLTISQRLAGLMGGEIVVRSVEGKGSCFTLRLPLREPGEWVAIDGGLESASGPEPSPAKVRASNLEGLRLLLAEDGRDNQILLLSFLRRAGASVVLATDGNEAIEVFEHAQANGEPFDLILMDMQMPRIDGYSATRTLRERGVTLPILAITAHAMRGDRERCLEAGCDAYLSKPVARDVLTATVARHCASKGAAGGS